MKNPDQQPASRLNRFSLSEDPIIKDRLAGVKRAVERMKHDCPEVLSFCLFGSMVKGTADKDSDVDGYLFVDLEMIAKKQEVSEGSMLTFSSNGFVFKEEINHKYLSLFHNIIKEETDLADSQLVHAKVIPVSEKIIKTDIEKLINDRKEYVIRLTEWLKSKPDIGAGIDALEEHEDRIPRLDNDVPFLRKMFGLAVDNGIKKYRKMFIEELIKLGSIGEGIWSSLIGVEEMADHFNEDEVKRHYPRTLEEAMKVYGK